VLLFFVFAAVRPALQSTVTVQFELAIEEDVVAVVALNVPTLALASPPNSRSHASPA